ncbi:O-Methyltransferase involved in polyketide biosynthesis [Slackia heliotrinireducens]|uniref:O-methyltransferase involved in polyketide biosynthesis n=1 Tax=Slackia heliotrinireducens (strain ATCC 29202 / DSM 20476 / NCTC 11029 / RHS 1) TaxID=471855 RepID=C7N734_SLAHD|nr:class I SAM-dependent methyltransferase [Slackia heliotrinireducens]ACV22719.1 O-methyltransferase involved in polyketide biosynthesis [Slackia heliotrinireducens DSM 20476]VEH01344.1 O-Methyltransferase involved in polyketide biosynthesis [Slackia heliotrinireducens]
MDKMHIEKDTVQETLVIPLYGRKLCTERFPSLFQDPKAVELIDRLDYDYEAFATKASKLSQEFGALEVAMRQTDLAFEVRDYLSTHPNAAVVNLGCGLDQTGENCDNGTCKIYNVDFPDIIEIRDQLVEKNDRTFTVAADLNDLVWFDRIDASDGAVFFAAGVFYYFKKEDIQRLFTAMAKRFPGGRLAFDAAGTRAVKIMFKTMVKDAGITSVTDYFSVDDLQRDVASWMIDGKVSSRGYMLGYNDLKDPSVPGLFRLLAKVADGFMKMCIVRIDFNG